MPAKSLKPLLLLLWSVVASSLSAQATIYLTLHSGCSDELEYAQASSGLRSRAYSLSFSNEQYIFYTTDSGVSITSLPQGTVSCRDLQLNQGLIDGINSGIQQVSVVQQQTDGSWLLLPVTSAQQIIKSGSFYVLRDKEYVAAMDTNQLVYESNLAGPGSAGNVFLSGLKVYDCKVLYAMRSQSADGQGDEVHFDFAPGIGMLSISRGLTPSALQYNRTDLVKVNGYELADWITRLCGGPVAPPAPTPGITPPVAGGAAKYHTVGSGETLNSIARQYNVSVNSLLVWNQINNPNMIKKGQQLLVSDPGTSTPVLPGKPSSPQGITGGQQPDPGLPANLPTYTIKQGEKLADIAARFGYTEAHFRKINSLPPRIELAAGTVIIASDCPCKRTVETGAATTTAPGSTTQPTVTRQDQPPATATPEKPYTDIRFIEYTVKQGDTMTGLAERYKIDVKELAYLNSKRVDEKLVPGQKLYIPVSQ